MACAPKLGETLTVLIIRLWIIKLFTRGLKKMLSKRKVDPSLLSFAASFLGTLLRILLITRVMGMMGIQMTSFTAHLTAVDNKVIILPNGPLAINDLINYTKEETRRIDWAFGIAYGDKIEDLKRAMSDFIKEDKRIFSDPDPFIGLSDLADSSVHFALRVWASKSGYWGIFFDMNGKSTRAFTIIISLSPFFSWISIIIRKEKNNHEGERFFCAPSYPY